MGSKPSVIIPVETKSREFHGKLWQALHLMLDGYPVLLGEQGRLQDYCDLVDPGIYLDKSVATTRVDWFKRCRAMGHEVISWDEEGLVFFDSWVYQQQRLCPEAFDQVSCFFAWGEMHREAICEKYPYYNDKILLGGNPRFDFLRPELRSFYQPKVDQLKHQYGPMILINTNFAFYNHFKSPDEVRHMMANYPISKEPGFMDGWITMHQEVHEAYLKMAPEVLAHFPDHTVVVRPHPSESHVPWLHLAEKHPRLHVDSSGNVHEWILAAEAVIHFNCTTAIEAFLLDVPPIAYRPNRYPRYENELPNSLSEQAFSLDQLLEAIAKRETARQRKVLWTEEQKNVASRYISGLTGKTAAERITDGIRHLMSGRDLPQKTIGKRLLKGTKKQWRIKLHAFREFRNPSDGYDVQKFPGLTASEIEYSMNRMLGLCGKQLDIIITPFSKNCFWLRPA